MNDEAMDKRIEAVNARIKFELLKRGDNLKAASERAGLNYGVVRRYLAGEREMPLRILIQLSDAIGVSPWDILSRAEEVD